MRVYVEDELNKVQVLTHSTPKEVVETSAIMHRSIRVLRRELREVDDDLLEALERGMDLVDVGVQETNSVVGGIEVGRGTSHDGRE